MPKDHRSFFERLTGSVNAVEDDEEEIVREPMITTEKTKSAAKAGDWMNEEEEMFFKRQARLLFKLLLPAQNRTNLMCPLPRTW